MPALVVIACSLPDCSPRFPDIQGRGIGGCVVVSFAKTFWYDWPSLSYCHAVMEFCPSSVQSGEVFKAAFSKNI